MRVQLRNITKRFGARTVNDGIDLEMRPGEVLALLGENGAGKSTTMKILYGLYQPDAGEILLDGAPVRFASPAEAIARGIGMVHQHFMLVPSFTVAENVAMGGRTGLGLRLDEVSRRLTELSERFQLHVDPNALVSDLSVGAQQRVEILRVLYRGARVLIFDEPTAVLSPLEVDQFLSILGRLRDDGCATVLITHKLGDVMQIADRISVLRDGKLVAGDIARAEATPESLARLMVGRDVPPVPAKAEVPAGDVVLRVRDLACVGGDGLPALRGITFELRAGEILGVAGIDGNGQAELVEVLAGLRPATGEVHLGSTPVLGWNTAQLLAAGVAHIPQDRHRMGLLMGSTLMENLAVAECDREPLSRFGFLRGSAIRERARRLLKDWSIRPNDENALAESLSGGNQQKVVLARELSRNPAVILAAQPVRGLDISAIQAVHTELLRQRERGAAILLVSTDLDEILTIADRIAVMHQGAIVGFANPTTELSLIGQMMAGHAATNGGNTHE
ncbi:MAG TPA: ABC transporter ATP-binding protein [Symbiobacteriaceae bacterium]|nr:ABC transporter ATP-binding protein [Symbiobacteriaceae bacterium]